jgi:hypothetical protein
MTEAGKALGVARQTISSYVKSGGLLKNTYIITLKASSAPTPLIFKSRIRPKPKQRQIERV